MTLELKKYLSDLRKDLKIRHNPAQDEEKNPEFPRQEQEYDDITFTLSDLDNYDSNHLTRLQGLFDNLVHELLVYGLDEEDMESLIEKEKDFADNQCQAFYNSLDQKDRAITCELVRFALNDLLIQNVEKTNEKDIPKIIVIMSFIKANSLNYLLNILRKTFKNIVNPQILDKMNQYVLNFIYKYGLKYFQELEDQESLRRYKINGSVFGFLGGAGIPVAVLMPILGTIAIPIPGACSVGLPSRLIYNNFGRYIRRIYRIFNWKAFRAKTFFLRYGYK